MKSYFYKCTSIQTTSVVTVNLEVLFNTSNMKEAKKKNFCMWLQESPGEQMISVI